MVNVDRSSGAFDCRAFEALAGYRRQARGVFFGQFLAMQEERTAELFDDVIFVGAGAVCIQKSSLI
jgi:hypothetical protein